MMTYSSASRQKSRNFTSSREWWTNSTIVPKMIQYSTILSEIIKNYTISMVAHISFVHHRFPRELTPLLFRGVRQANLLRDLWKKREQPAFAGENRLASDRI